MLIVILGILVIIYLFKNRYEVVNMEYKEGNIVIEYPYFKNNILDEKIVLYVNDKITSFKYREMDFMFLDYDYRLDGEKVDLKFYYYEFMDNIFRREEVSLYANLDKEEVISVISNSEKVEYDIYTNRVIDKNKPIVAITFDDGPNHNTSGVIDILNKYGVKATFFVLGRNIVGNENTIRKMYDSGMEVGSHLYSHKLLTKMDEGNIKEEYDKTREMIFEITLEYPKVTRPSYGSSNIKVKSAIDSPIIGWNIDTLDWKYHNSNYISKKILNNVKDGSIILMHDIYSATLNAIDIVIPKLLDEGYQLVTVSDLFYYKGIELEKHKLYRSAL